MSHGVDAVGLAKLDAPNHGAPCASQHNCNMLPLHCELRLAPLLATLLSEEAGANLFALVNP
jgi:hypothetical protein